MFAYIVFQRSLANMLVAATLTFKLTLFCCAPCVSADGPEEEINAEDGSRRVGHLTPLPGSE